MHVSAIVHFLVLFFAPLSLVVAIKSTVLFAAGNSHSVVIRALAGLAAIYTVYGYFTDNNSSTDLHVFDHPLLFAGLAAGALKYSATFATRVLIVIAFRVSAAVIRAALATPGSLFVPVALCHGLLPLGFAAVTGKPITNNPYHVLAICGLSLGFLGEGGNMVQAGLRLALCLVPIGMKHMQNGDTTKYSPAPLPIHMEIGKEFVDTELCDITVVDEDALIQEIHDISRLEV